MSGDVGRLGLGKRCSRAIILSPETRTYREMSGDVGKCREISGDLGRYWEISGAHHLVPRARGDAMRALGQHGRHVRPCGLDAVADVGGECGGYEDELERRVARGEGGRV